MEPSSDKDRVLLAELFAHSGRPVPASHLAEALWPGRQPAQPANAVQVRASRLRGLLRKVGADHTLVTRPAGYELSGLDSDAAAFELLLQRAKHAEDAGVAAGHLREALALWRGTPFAGIGDVPCVEHETRRLEELRLGAMEDLAEAELELGEHRRLSAELGAVAEAHPLRERLWSALMLALHRSGRRAEALAAYRKIRDLLVTELGIEPGASLTDLHQRILAGAPELDGGAAAEAGRLVHVPRQLPLDPATFTGRDVELAELLTHFAEYRGAVPIAVLDGPAGVGKSALAVRAAHRLAGRYPDGQIFLRLRGAMPGLTPMASGEVAGQALRALGVHPSEVPGDPEEAGAQFRSRVAGRRLLMVLDDVASPAQIRHILPAEPGCGVLVTSRGRVSTLDDARHLRLGVLDSRQAWKLLARLAGEARLAAEQVPAAEVIEACGGLPLALRIAGARLAARPYWPVAGLAGLLADERHRLDELRAGDLEVRCSFEVGYAQLSGRAAEAFRVLGLVPGPDLPAGAAGALLGTDDVTATGLLSELADAQLADCPRGRYRAHDLLRLYARELAGLHEPPGRPEQVRARLLGWYTSALSAARLVLSPPRPRDAQRELPSGVAFAGPPAALAWLDQERTNLLALLHASAVSPGPELPMFVEELMWALHYRRYLNDLLAAGDVGLVTARQLGSRRGEAAVLGSLAGGYWSLSRNAEAARYLERAAAIWREVGDRAQLARTCANLALIHDLLGRHEEAEAGVREAIAVYAALGDHRGQGIAWCNLGESYRKQGRVREAFGCYLRSIEHNDLAGHRLGSAVSLSNSAIVHLADGDVTAALSAVERSLPVHREFGDREGEAECLITMSEALSRRGRHRQALATAREGLAICDAIGWLPGRGRARTLLSTLESQARSVAA